MTHTYDEGNNVGYLYVKQQISPREVAETITVDGGSIMLDFDKQGALLGIEFLNAKKQMAALLEDERRAESW